MTPDERAEFIRRETLFLPVPHAPEIGLHVADSATALWQKTEEELGAMGLPPPFWAFAWAGGQALARYILDNPALVARIVRERIPMTVCPLSNKRLQVCPDLRQHPLRRMMARGLAQ